MVKFRRLLASIELALLVLLGCSAQNQAVVRQGVTQVGLPACDILQDIDPTWLAGQLSLPKAAVESARDACYVLGAVDRTFTRITPGGPIVRVQDLTLAGAAGAVP
jgi:hypothetical protein